MKYGLYLALGVSLSALVGCGGKETRKATEARQSSESSVSSESSTTATDPYLYMEEVEGEKALAFVKAKNADTLAELSEHPRFSELKKDLRAIYESKDILPRVSIRGSFVYDFLEDVDHPRGLWRRATVDAFITAQGKPTWESILDIDALGKAEGESWVFAGAGCLLPPSEHLCLVELSRGGKDAAVVREFNTRTKAFVTESPFRLEEGKHGWAFLDENTLIVSPDLGGSSLTASGYPRTVGFLKRGEGIESFKPVFEGEASDMGVWANVLTSGDKRLVVIEQWKTFYTSKKFVFDLNGKLVPLAIPEDATLNGLQDDALIVRLASDWIFEGRTIAAGSLVAFDHTSNTILDVLFTPTRTAFLDSAIVVGDTIVLTVLDNVRSRLLTLRRAGSTWESSEIALPGIGSASISSYEIASKRTFFTFESYTEPRSLHMVDLSLPDAAPTRITSGPKLFGTENLVTEQLFATSADGTKVPYFVVRKSDITYDGTNPTMLYGYGGFEISLTPSFSNTIGMAWLEKGGVFVVANIRGGGEFGPAWHQAALKENRQRAYDDFISVAEALIASKITSPAHLGINGGSNGGLLVGAVMVQRPELFNAVLCEVPLLDMLRFHKLLAGASWMGEYGNPDEPGAAADAMRAYSPYQNVKPGVKYPKILLTTSTKDDRVHPAHARKMAARLLEYGNEVLYFENLEGGHSGGADVEQSILESSIQYTYLWKQLGSK